MTSSQILFSVVCTGCAGVWTSRHISSRTHCAWRGERTR